MRAPPPRDLPAVAAKAAQDDVVLGDGDAGARLECGKGLVRDDTGHGNEFVAARAQEMVVVRGGKLEARPPVLKQHFAQGAGRDELLRGAKDGRKIRRSAGARKPRMKLFERPSVALVARDEVGNGAGDSGFSGHLRFIAQAIRLRKTAGVVTQVTCIYLRKQLA